MAALPSLVKDTTWTDKQILKAIFTCTRHVKLSIYQELIIKVVTFCIEFIQNIHTQDFHIPNSVPLHIRVNMGIKMHNNLPLFIKNLNHDIKVFVPSLKYYLLSQLILVHKDIYLAINLICIV